LTGNDRDTTESFNTGWKIYVSSVQDGSVYHLTTYTKARTQQPKFSPSGNLLAYMAMDRVGLESDRLHLELFDLNSKQRVPVTDSIDKSVTDFKWQNETHILFTVIEIGYSVLYSIDVRDPANTLVKQFSHEYLSASIPLSIPNS